MVMVGEESANFGLVLVMCGYSWPLIIVLSFYRSRVAALGRACAPRFALGGSLSSLG
jgi:hypothetical protein